MVLWIGFDLQAEIEAGGEYNSTPLHNAARFGKEAVAAQLLQAGASVSAVNDSGSNAPALGRVKWQIFNCKPAVASQCQPHGR